MATLRRVAANVDRVSERLRARGWRPFAPRQLGDLRCLPSAADERAMRRIAEVIGEPLPPALAAFWTIVGGVNWVWDHEHDEAPDLGAGLDLSGADPLCLYPARSVAEQLECHVAETRELDPDLADPLRLVLAPDALHKANISGGPPYAVELPFAGADPILRGEPHGLPLVAYLRLCFRWAGFPGLEAHARRPQVQRFVAEVRDDLEPF